MDISTQFPYVDAHHQPKNTKPKQWKRILIRDIEKELIAPAKNQNVFCTVQRFRDSIQTKGVKQVHYCGLYFDFDAKPETYGSEEKAIEAAKKDVGKLAEYFRNMDIAETAIRVWYSGSKGFHLLVAPEIFAFKPSMHLTYIMHEAAIHVAKMLNLKTLDLTVYTHRRQWRLDNSIHQSSGRFKIELYHAELSSPAEAIIELASSPREPLYDACEYEDIGQVEEAVRWWNTFRKSYEHKQDLKKLEPTKKVVITKEWPACVRDIIENGLKSQGTRNRATMALSSYFMDTGLTPAATKEILIPWAAALPDPGGSKKLERVANTKAVVDSIFASKNHFACAFIRDLSSADNKVACTHPNCDTIENEPDNQRPAKIPRVPLSKASEAVYIGKKVSIPVMITGKADSPYAYPKKVKITCTPNPDQQICTQCNVMPHGGEVDIEFNMHDQTLIDLVNCTDSRRNSVIKRHAGIPAKCYAHNMKILEQGNIEEVRLQPNVTSGGLVDSRNGNGKSQIDPIEEGDYCTRLAYYIGHDIGINRKYDVNAYVLGHPRDQKICHLFDEADPSQDDIDKFKMTGELRKRLQIFKVQKNQTVSHKFKEMHDDFENNVHMIWGRREVAVAVDLVYHSVLSFQFQSQVEKKGWVELLILGDSGNGKTKLVERMMQHYQLGEITGVEGGKRTGLIWANHNVGGRFMLTWGKIPQNDRRLIVLDEFSGMPDEEVATMTRLRTEGLAESQGINPAQTNARTRMIFLSNARNGRPLDAHNYGVEAVNALFKEHQDVRRLDLAVCVKSGDIPLEVINKKHVPDPKSHNYQTDLCKKLVLWAWSRSIRQIKILPETEERILVHAIELGKKYRCDITLVEPSDQRLKVARLACAVAARVFSTDDGENLIVKPEHVDFAVKFLHACYDHRAMEYGAYAKERQRRMYLPDKKRSEIKRHIMGYRDYEDMIGIFMGGNYFRKGELQDLTGLDKETIGNLLKFLSQNFLIHSTSAGYRKTPIFTEFLKKFDTIDSTEPDF